MAHNLPKAVMDDLGAILPALLNLGYAPVPSQYSPSSFGDYYVDFAGQRDHSFRILRDRSQYIVDGERDDLEEAGLWRAFNSRDEFAAKLLNWIRSRTSN